MKENVKVYMNTLEKKKSAFLFPLIITLSFTNSLLSAETKNNKKRKWYLFGFWKVKHFIKN